MGKRKHRDPTERQARARRREARSERSIHQKVMEIAAKEYESRLEHELTLSPEKYPMLHDTPVPEGWVGGEFKVPNVTPKEDDGEHDSTTTTG